MAYSFLKFKDLTHGGEISYRPCRVSHDFTIYNTYYFIPINFDTNFPNLSLPSTGTTFSISLPQKSAFLKAPNLYFQKYQYQLVRYWKYQLVQKDENNAEYDSYVFNFGIMVGWQTREIVYAGTDSPKYYKQNCRVTPVFSIYDNDGNDVTRTLITTTSCKKFAPSNSYYPKGWYYDSGQEMLYTQQIPTYDVNLGTYDSKIRYANYDSDEDEFTKLTHNFLFYYLANDTTKYLCIQHGLQAFMDYKISDYTTYYNTYAELNVSGVDVNVNPNGSYFTSASTQTSIILDYNPTYNSDEDISSDIEDESNDTQSTGNNSTNYGNGIGEDSTEYIDFPSLTSENPATTSGLYRLVKIDTANLTTLSEFLWSTTPLDTLIKVFSKPFDCIVSLLTLPYNVTADTSTSELKILDYDTGVNVYKNVYTNESVSFGLCDCNESFGNFLDYDNTKVSIYLPYIGFQPLDVQDVMDAVLTLVYNIDNQTGQCVALLKCTKNNMDVDSVTYSWSGNLANQLPLNGVDNTQYLQSLFNSISSVAMGTVGGSITQSFNTVMQGDKQIMKSGRLDGNTGNLSIMYPFIKIERPIWTRPDTYLTMQGQPFDATETLSNLSGYVKVKEVKSELSNVPLEMQDRIIELLKEGVYI